MAEPILEEKFHMKRVSAVICEFNPLHTGHGALLSHASDASDVLVCVMSGNFTQRSECALYDKYKRAEAAIKLGADIVVELPFPYSSAGAEFFAFGGVSVAHALGCEHFIFGSESGDTDFVSRASHAAASDEFAALFEIFRDSASGAAVSHDRAMRKLGFALGSNDKLAMHYMLAARRVCENATFEAFFRITDKSLYRSASDIRKMIFDGRWDEASHFIPTCLHKIYPHESDVIPDRLCEIEYLYYRMRRNCGDASLSGSVGGDFARDCAFFEGEGGVSERLYHSAYASRGHAEFFANAATKHYTDSRLRRAALYELLCVRREDVSLAPAVTQLLAASRAGREYLSSRRRCGGMRIMTKPSFVPGDERERRAAELIRRADELYSLCMRRETAGGEFLRRRPYID